MPPQTRNEAAGVQRRSVSRVSVVGVRRASAHMSRARCRVDHTTHAVLLGHVAQPLLLLILL